MILGPALMLYTSARARGKTLPKKTKARQMKK